MKSEISIHTDEVADFAKRVSGSNVRVQYNGGPQSDESILKENKGKIITKKGTLDAD